MPREFYMPVVESLAPTDFIRAVIPPSEGQRNPREVNILLSNLSAAMDAEQAIHPSVVVVREANDIWVMLDDTGIRIKPGQLGGALNAGAKVSLYDAGVLELRHGDGSTPLRVVLGAASANNPALVPVTDGALKVQVGLGETYAPVDVSELRVNGTKVVGARGAAVADATDAGSAITQLNALLARCRAHGLIS